MTLKNINIFRYEDDLSVSEEMDPIPLLGTIKDTDNWK